MKTRQADELRVVVVDDEALARRRLAAMVQDASGRGGPAARVVAEMGDAREALAWLGAHEADVVLLDVQMPGLDGLGLAARLSSLPSPPVVVFVTAHSQHAVRAFDLEAADYLTKPVRSDRLERALDRVARRLAAIDKPAPKAPADATSAAQEQVIVVTERGRLERVPLGEVLYLRAELKYVTLRTSQRAYLLEDALTDLEQRLGPPFVRIHRSALVSLPAVRALERRITEDEGAEGWAVHIGATDEWLPVSRRQLPAVRDALSGGA